MKRERERVTQVGLIIGAGAAKTGWFRMSLGGVDEEEEEELREAKTQGRNVGFLMRECT